MALRDQEVNPNCALRELDFAAVTFLGGWMSKTGYSDKCTSMLIDALAPHLARLQTDGIIQGMLNDMVTSAATRDDCVVATYEDEEKTFGLDAMSGALLIHAICFGVLLVFFCIMKAATGRQCIQSLVCWRRPKNTEVPKKCNADNEEPERKISQGSVSAQRMSVKDRTLAVPRQPSNPHQNHHIHNHHFNAHEVHRTNSTATNGHEDNESSLPQLKSEIKALQEKLELLLRRQNPRQLQANVTTAVEGLSFNASRLMCSEDVHEEGCAISCPFTCGAEGPSHTSEPEPVVLGERSASRISNDSLIRDGNRMQVAL